MKLTDTMLIILTDAAKRSDRVVIPPERLKGAAAEKVLGKFLGAGLVAEVRAARGMPEWKRDEAGPRALVLTDEGLKAIGADPNEGEAPVAEKPQRSSPARGKTPTTGRAKPSASRERTGKKASRPADGDGSLPPRAGSKTGQLIGLLQQLGGATTETLTATLGWLPHTTRAAITGLRKRGFSIERIRAKGGPTAYRITGEPPALTSPEPSRPAKPARRAR